MFSTAWFFFCNDSLIGPSQSVFARLGGEGSFTTGGIGLELGPAEGPGVGREGSGSSSRCRLTPAVDDGEVWFGCSRVEGGRVGVVVLIDGFRAGGTFFFFGFGDFGVWGEAAAAVGVGALGTGVAAEAGGVGVETGFLVFKGGFPRVGGTRGLT